MSNGSRVNDIAAPGSVTVSFGEHFQASAHFDQVFKEGMALVERTAAYLDGKGRRDSKGLAGRLTVLYATESMRLTTRLLDLASWLLIRRSLREGEITEEQAREKRARVKLQSLGRPSHIRGLAELPAGIRHLIEQSFVLQDRIIQLDRALGQSPDGDNGSNVHAINPVAAQLDRLHQAFALKLN